jgi:hypothetical protein
MVREVSILFRNDPPENRISVLGIPVPVRVARWFVRLWIFVVVVGSLLPGSAKASLHASQARRTYSGSTKHRLIHFGAFGSSFLVLSILAIGRREQLEAAAEVMTIGCIVEVTQYFVYSHAQVFEWWDVRDDAIGIAVAFLLVQIVGPLNLSGSRS